MSNLVFIQDTLEKYGLSDRFDAKKVLRKIGGKRPGKRCKGGWIAADKQCSDHKTADGKLTAAGKSSASELAARVRDRKGMQEKREVEFARRSLAENLAPLKGVATEAHFTPQIKVEHGEARSGLNARRAKAGLPAIVDKDAAKPARTKAKAKAKIAPRPEPFSLKINDLDVAYKPEFDRFASDAKAHPRYKTVQKVLDKIEKAEKAKRGESRPIDPLSALVGIYDPKDLLGYEYRETGATGRSKKVKAVTEKDVESFNSAVSAINKKLGFNSKPSMWDIAEKFSQRSDSDDRQWARWDSAMERIGIKYGLRFDRAIMGGKSSASTRKKHTCTTRSHQCGSVCVPLKNKCRKGDLGNAQERLKKLRASGADDLLVRKAKNSLVERTGDKRKTIDENRVTGLRNRLKNSTMSGVGKSEGLGEIDPSSIEVDPKRFQYKIIGEHNATGSVGSLAGVKRYDPNLAGILQVWKDPADGKTYVVNGHNRLDLGKKLGAESVAVRYLKAPDAKTARSIGALTNIAEGRGDALDAAKFFRDTGISKEDLSAKGIPMREKIATDGLALSKLDDSLFRRTIDGDIPMARAAIVGGSGLDATQQRDLMKLVDKEGKKKSLTDAAISEMVDIAKSSQTFQESTMSLFGEESVTKSNMIEKAKLQASIKQRLSREKNLFGTVSRGRAADELARGGNTIDKSKSGEISAAADQSLRVFDQMKNSSGPVSTAINKAASRMAAGESQKSVEKDLYAEISSIDAFGRTKKLAA